MNTLLEAVTAYFCYYVAAVILLGIGVLYTGIALSPCIAYEVITRLVGNKTRRILCQAKEKRNKLKIVVARLAAAKVSVPRGLDQLVLESYRQALRHQRSGRFLKALASAKKASSLISIDLLGARRIESHFRRLEDARQSLLSFSTSLSKCPDTPPLCGKLLSRATRSIASAEYWLFEKRDSSRASTLAGQAEKNLVRITEIIYIANREPELKNPTQSKALVDADFSWSI